MLDFLKTHILLELLSLWNIAIFIVYAFDKLAAIKDWWRMPENSLLMMTLFAGGPGAALAGHLCRHKTRKLYFRLSWWIGTGLFVLLLAIAYF